MPSKLTLPRTCLQCGAGFLAHESDVLAGWGKYCSKKCSYQSQRVDRTSPEWKAQHRAKVKAAKDLFRKRHPERVKATHRKQYLRRNAHRKPLTQIKAERAAKSMLLEKPCAKCGEVKPLSKFRLSKRTADGRTSQCAKCLWTRIKSWKDKRREKERELDRIRYKKNPQRARDQSRAYRERNPEAVREYLRRYAKKNPELMREKTNRRRMLKLSIPGSHTTAEWESLCKQFKNLCVKCGEKRPLTRDHVIPITRPGSSDFIANIQPLCKSCNSRKFNTAAIDYRLTPFTGRGQIVMFC